MPTRKRKGTFPGSQERGILLFTETPVSISCLIGLDGVLCHPQTSHYKASGDKAEMGEVASQRKCGVLVGREMDAGCPRELSSTAQDAELVSDLVHTCAYPLGSDKLLRGRHGFRLMLLGQSLRKAVITILDPIPCAEVLPSRALSLLFCGLEPVSIAKQCKSFWSLAHGALTSVNVCNKCFVYKGSGLVLHLFGLPCT